MKLSHYVLASVIGTSMLCGTAMAQSGAPQGFSYGVGVGVNQEIYQGYSNRTIPLPIIGYQGDRLTVYGPFVSYKLLDLGNISFSAKLAPRFAGFDESDSAVFSGMAKRKDSIDGGIGMQLRQDSWKFEAQTVFDLLGNSNGQESKLSVGYSYRAGPVIIEPQFGVSYSDGKLVDSGRPAIHLTGKTHGKIMGANHTIKLHHLPQRFGGQFRLLNQLTGKIGIFFNNLQAIKQLMPDWHALR